MVGRQGIRHENGAANDQRVEGRAFHPTQDAVMVGSQIIRHEHGAVIRRVDGCAVHAVMVGKDVAAAVQASILPTLGQGVRV